MLKQGRARVHRIYPFAIRLTDRAGGDEQPVRIKIDPGSQFTGMALVREETESSHVLSLFELRHRGRQISEALTARRRMRRARRGRKTRYRAPRFLNRRRAPGWIAPSLQHRVDTTIAWVARLRKLSPVVGIVQELVRFDMQAMESPGIEGAQYQRGELAGYEVREYLLEKWGRQCAYCDIQDVPMQIEHIVPLASGGSNRVSNLTLACGPCNQKKAALPLELFLKKDLARAARIKAQCKRPLKDAAVVNSTRWVLFNTLKATGLPVEVASGGRTKFNRTALGVPKSHALDAACVGEVKAISGWDRQTLAIKCVGRGAYQRTRLNAGGGVRGYLMRQKRVHGFATGDMVRAVIASGKNAGTHSGRVAVRKTGSFAIATPTGKLDGVSWRHLSMVQRADGYGYSIERTH